MCTDLCFERSCMDIRCMSLVRHWRWIHLVLGSNTLKVDFTRPRPCSPILFSVRYQMSRVYFLPSLFSFSVVVMCPLLSRVLFSWCDRTDGGHGVVALSLENVLHWPTSESGKCPCLQACCASSCLLKCSFRAEIPLFDHSC
jgi:hypothetical protein